MILDCFSAIYGVLFSIHQFSFHHVNGHHFELYAVSMTAMEYKFSSSAIVDVLFVSAMTQKS